MKPGKRGDNKDEFEDALQPLCSRWAPLILTTVLNSLCHTSARLDAFQQSRQVTLASLQQILPGLHAVNASAAVHECHALALLRSALQLLGMVTSDESQTQLRTPAGRKAGCGVVRFALCQLRWVVALIHLNANGQSNKLDVMSPGLPNTQQTRVLCQSMLTQPSGSPLRVVDLLAFDKNGLTRSLRALLETASEALGKAEEKSIRHEVLLLTLSAAVADSRTEDPQSVHRAGFYKLLSRMADEASEETQEAVPSAVAPELSVGAYTQYVLRTVLGIEALPHLLAREEETVEQQQAWVRGVLRHHRGMRVAAKDECEVKEERPFEADLMTLASSEDEDEPEEFVSSNPFAALAD